MRCFRCVFHVLQDGKVKNDNVQLNKNIYSIIFTNLRVNVMYILLIILSSRYITTQIFLKIDIGIIEGIIKSYT